MREAGLQSGLKAHNLEALRQRPSME